MKEYEYLPTESGGLIRKATVNLLPHELEFVKETEEIRYRDNPDKALLSAAVKKLFEKNKTEGTVQ